MTERPIHEYVPQQPFGPEIAEILNNPNQRPATHVMIDLVTQGMTEAHVLDAAEAIGFERPHMDLTLQEIDTGLPYIFEFVDNIAERYGDKRALFMARDAELLHDAYTVVHGDKQAALFPGSISFLEWVRSNRKLPVTQEFLRRWNVTPDRDFFIDTGFRGYAGFLMWTTLSPDIVGSEGLVDNAKMEAFATRMPIKLLSQLSMLEQQFGEQLVDFDRDELLEGEDMFPKATMVYRPYHGGERDSTERDPLAYRLALSLQVMPHFHGAFEALEATAHGVAVSVRPEPIVQNVDQVSRNAQAGGRNASIVNPVAALVLQHRVVQMSLQYRASGK